MNASGPTGGRLAWLAWGAAGAFVLYQFLLQASTSVMEAELVREFHLDRAGFGIISAGFYYAYLLLQLPAGIVVVRYGPRRVMTGGLLICMGASWLFGLSHVFPTAELARILMGLGASTAVVSALTLAARWFPPAQFALVAGLTEMLGMVGGAIGQEVLGEMVHLLGWREAMLACGALGAALALFAWLAVRDKPPQTAADGPPPPPLGEALRSIWQLLQRHDAWINGLVVALVFGVTTAFGLGWSVPFLELRLGVELRLASFASSLLFWGSVAGLPLAGWLSEKIGRRKPLLWAGTVLSLILLLLLLYWPGLSYIGACILLTLLGLTISCYVLCFAIAGDSVSEAQHGLAMAFTNMMSLLFGGIILQPLIGWILDLQIAEPLPVAHGVTLKLTAYQEALGLLPLSLIVALLLLIFLPESHPRRRH